MYLPNVTVDQATKNDVGRFLTPADRVTQLNEIKAAVEQLLIDPNNTPPDLLVDYAARNVIERISNYTKLVRSQNMICSGMILGH